MNNIIARYKKRILLPLDILEKPQKGLNTKEQVLTRWATLIEGAFQAIDIKSKILEIAVGPQFLRYLVEIESNTSLEEVIDSSGDISISIGLSEQDVVIYKNFEMPLCVYIQIPNPHPYYIYLRKYVAQEYDWEEDDGLPIILGQSLEGKMEGCDFKKIDNLLIAGAPTSGKTIFLYSSITNLLFRKTSKELKFIVIDPKDKDMRMLESLPHLLLPVASSEEKITESLEYLDKLIKERAEALKGVKDIWEYNSKNVGKEMFNVIVVIDEFSDLMLKGRSENLYHILENGSRLGIHMILSTSCMIEKVFTEKLKRLIPSRIAFALGSVTDSRMILNERGAVNLVGNGDLLYKEKFYSIPKRLQGVYVSDIDMGKIVEYLKEMED